MYKMFFLHRNFVYDFQLDELTKPKKP